MSERILEPQLESMLAVDPGIRNHEFSQFNSALLSMREFRVYKHFLGREGIDFGVGSILQLPQHDPNSFTRLSMEIYVTPEMFRGHQRVLQGQNCREHAVLLGNSGTGITTFLLYIVAREAAARRPLMFISESNQWSFLHPSGRAFGGNLWEFRPDFRNPFLKGILCLVDPAHVPVLHFVEFIDATTLCLLHISTLAQGYHDILRQRYPYTHIIVFDPPEYGSIREMLKLNDKLPQLNADILRGRYTQYGPGLNALIEIAIHGSKDVDRRIRQAVQKLTPNQIADVLHGTPGVEFSDRNISLVRRVIINTTSSSGEVQPIREDHSDQGGEHSERRARGPDGLETTSQSLEYVEAGVQDPSDEARGPDYEELNARVDIPAGANSHTTSDRYTVFFRTPFIADAALMRYKLITEHQ